MLSATLDSSGSPIKRAFSRGVSEDESLRNIIKETESSSRRLARSDSRAGTLKRRTKSQTEQELFMGLPEMLELQASYEEAVTELRGLEVERDTLLFQVDVLQDSLEGVEELLAEAQREAGQANTELEREREARRKLESMVSALMKEVERLKEESHNAATEKETHTDEPDSSPVKDNESRATASPAAEVDEPVLEKLRKLVSRSPVRMPSLALDSVASEEGVLQRPYENCLDDEKTDTDSISAYEDAPSDTPDNDRPFPGEGAVADLPRDSDESTAAEQEEGDKSESCVIA